ncbi:hypothetical protein H310_07694 [Aphanomyces invadans]|uniref:Uncharacterized protein n=1 Tax=Aphanomyces invadans TaxID=157072 RepID=A0A024U249_9STRA|nr:hypothetical protein H310_07694 [Aphanomyces invadans]ETW00324.1 hypothetical protein H310_07694 [Aphanomyces invadans]|eukprot:XP_008871349.1 hypothetical protein H310_07694 [Aphanomyces invadans]
MEEFAAWRPSRRQDTSGIPFPRVHGLCSLELRVDRRPRGLHNAADVVECAGLVSLHVCIHIHGRHRFDAQEVVLVGRVASRRHMHRDASVGIDEPERWSGREPAVALDLVHEGVGRRRVSQNERCPVGLPSCQAGETTTVLPPPFVVICLLAPVEMVLQNTRVQARQTRAVDFAMHHRMLYR